MIDHVNAADKNYYYRLLINKCHGTENDLER